MGRTPGITHNRLADGLTAEERRFAVLLCQGMPQIDALKTAFRIKRIKPDNADLRARRLKNNARIKDWIAGFLAQARVEDLTNAGIAISELLEDLAKARESGNLAVALGYHDRRLRVLSLMRDTLVVSAEGKMHDEELILRLAGGDATKAAVLRAALAPAGFGPQKAYSGPDVPSGESPKH